MHVCVFVCVYVCVCVCVCVCACVRACVCKHSPQVTYIKGYLSNFMYVCIYISTVGIIIEGPSTVIYFPGQTMLPIELMCNVTGFKTWVVTINGTEDEFTLNGLAVGQLAGHGINADDNILINVPMNNSRYICVSNVASQRTLLSDPAFLYIAGKFNLLLNNC